MKNTMIIISIALLISQTAFAQTPVTDEPKITAGITPDSWLYGLDVAIDHISLLLTFDNGAKARKGLEIARERLLEVKEMVGENKLAAAKRAQSEHANVLGTVQSAVKGIGRTNSTKEIEEEIEIEKELEEHKTEIETVKGELKVKIKVKGKITPEQQAMIDSVLASLERKAGEVEIEIENEKGKTKIEIEQKTGKSSKEVEEEIEELEEKKGLKEIRKEKAWDKIKDAEEEINETIKKLSKLNITDRNITSALNALIQAKEAYTTGNFKEAIRLAEQAEDRIEDYKERFEEEEREIEVKIKGNQANVEVEVGGIKAKFVLETTDRDKIISEIASRTGLSTSEIKNIMELEIEKPEEEIEIEVEIEKGVAKVKVEINETESKFTLNTTNKERIISVIMSRTGLTREQVEKNVKFEIEEES